MGLIASAGDVEKARDELVKSLNIQQLSLFHNYKIAELELKIKEALK